ncbi:MAG: cytochrome C oxidase subunit IV family protein [Leptospiraceae bacterium]|nr:cytochrome C oxidase subunit IV family protein [Leptospiraceae bacterium]
MSEVLNYSLYIISLIVILIPFAGFGAAPPVIIKAALGLFGVNAYAQIVELKIIKLFLKDNKDNKALAPVLPLLEKTQEGIDMLEDPEFRKQKRKEALEKEHENHGHHIIPIPVYLGVLGILLLGTLITVWVAQFDFGSMNTVIAMLVATIKASFVLLYFMHLRYDNNMNRAIFGSAFFFLMILIAFSVIDIYTRIKPTKGF